MLESDKCYRRQTSSIEAQKEDRECCVCVCYILNRVVSKGLPSEMKFEQRPERREKLSHEVNCSFEENKSKGYEVGGSLASVQNISKATETELECAMGNIAREEETKPGR